MHSINQNQNNHGLEGHYAAKKSASYFTSNRMALIQYFPCLFYPDFGCIQYR